MPSFRAGAAADEYPLSTFASSNPMPRLSQEDDDRHDPPRFRPGMFSFGRGASEPQGEESQALLASGGDDEDDLVTVRVICRMLNSQ